MQAVILAAGKSTRTFPLTLDAPKTLLKILDKTLIEHTLDQLKGFVDEVVIVVGYKKEQIMDYLGEDYKGVKIVYTEQKEQKGTANALLAAKEYIKGKFIMLYGDDLYSRKDIKKLIEYDFALLAKKVDDPSRFGVLVVDKDNDLKEIVEKPDKFVSDLVSIGVFVFDKSIFGIIDSLEKSKRDEYELTDAVTKLASTSKVKVVETTDYWLPIGYWWNYLEANVLMLRSLKKSVIKGVVEDNVTVKGVLILGEDSVIKSGSYIEGPVYIGKNCEIGPHAYLRKDTIVMDGVRTRAEIIDSIVMDGTTAKHPSYIGHSVIGKNCNIAYGTVTADYRHDGKDNQTMINGKKVDSGRRKLGACLGDDVNTGINTLIYPGRKIWSGKSTLPGEIIKKDVK